MLLFDYKSRCTYNCVHAALALLNCSLDDGSTGSIRPEVSAKQTASWSAPVARSSLNAYLVRRPIVAGEGEARSNADLPRPVGSW